MDYTLTVSATIRRVATARSAMLLLATAALVVAGYLTVTSLIIGTEPAGCGAGSGCAEVMSTKWARWWGVPVSGLAALMYLAVLVAMALTGSRRPTWKRAGWLVLLAAAVAVVGAAVWFTYVQLAVIGVLCVYCTVDHSCGVVLSALIFHQALWRRDGSAPLRLTAAPAACAVALGVVGVVVLMVVQINTPAAVGRLQDVATDRDFDRVEAGVRHVGLLGGRFQLVVEEEPLLGPPRGTHLLALVLDYACPHCRHAHELLQELAQHRYGDDLTIIAVIVPMNRKCNPHAPEEMHQRFDHSCELAKLAQAVFLADPTRFVEFDRWMYEPEEPRTPEATRAEAERLVGKAKLAKAMTDPRLKQILDRNIKAYAHSGADRVPVILAPGAKPIVGRVEEADAIIELLEAGREAQEPTTERQETAADE